MIAFFTHQFCKKYKTFSTALTLNIHLTINRVMKNITPLALITLAATTLSGCELVAGIFKAGMWTGIFVVAIVLALIIWILAKLLGSKRD